ncbi:UBA and UBX domain-containing protein [Acorus gramineus]|uniref:UBA and UBX domain-containing protein n=1 Tax=Acorus gramineus TaxID=55184 RepID=A0AAV9AAT5_ACOGR|nr:UBA and UBX domain-containing protein [Acorus gramineus]
MESEDHQNLISTFIAITSSSREEALFFLESHNWQVDSAVQSFFDNDPIEEQHQQLPDERPVLPNPPSPPILASPAVDPPRSAMASSSRDKKPSSKPSGGGGRSGIRTLADLNRTGGESDSDSDGPPEYYTGGEKSGMLVRDPTKGKPNDVDAIFDHAMQSGALQGPPEPPSQPSRSFTGTGRLLSGETVPSAPPRPAESVSHNIVFWANGFTVDDGPLRRMDDPENASFLESIKNSECPKELQPADRRTAVNVNLIRREENYKEPERPYNPFQGVGRTLASESSAPSDPIVTPSTPNPSASSPSTVGLSVNESLPTTSIQLRLADGTRMVARFNYHHTVGDVRAFIDASRPGGARTYKLQTVGFPPKVLTDAAQTIEQAGIANSVVIQKM